MTTQMVARFEGTSRRQGVECDVGGEVAHQRDGRSGVEQEVHLQGGRYHGTQDGARRQSRRRVGRIRTLGGS